MTLEGDEHNSREKVMAPSELGGGTMSPDVENVHEKIPENEIYFVSNDFLAHDFTSRKVDGGVSMSDKVVLHHLQT